MIRWLWRALILTASLAAGLWLLEALLPGFSVADWQSGLLGLGALIAINVLVYPLVIRLALPAIIATFGLLALLLNGLAVLMVGWLVPGWKVDGVGTALLVALGLTALGMIATTVFLASDRPPYNLRRIRRLGRRAAPAEADRSPGLIILEIDGLSEPILRRALREGLMPTLQGWLDSGSHALVAWESDLPSC